MTREEAIEVYHGLINTKIKEAFEFFAPELRESESEDERIRKWLVEYFGSIKETVWIHRDITCGQILAWLEKQKESLHISESCKENADSFTDEDERVRKVIFKLLLGMREEIFTSQDEIVTKEKALAYLEKKPGIKIWPHPIKDAYLEQKEQKPVDDDPLNHPRFIDGFDTGREVQKIFDEPTKWSEEDKKILDDVSHILIGLNYKQIAKDYKQAVEKLIYARPGWKPTEEQMNVLGRFLKFLHESGSPDFGLMDSLLGQLKKI